MKRLLLLLFLVVPFMASAQSIEQQEDSLSAEDREIIQSMVEQHYLELADSLCEEGMYMLALEMLDSIQVHSKRIVGKEPTPLFFIQKGSIYRRLEDWPKIVETMNECLKHNQSTMSDNYAALVYDSQGLAYSNLEEYKNATRSYELALSHYTRLDKIECQADIQCRIGYCYDKSGSRSLAESFYEKGIAKYFIYFNKTKRWLLQNKMKADDPYVQAAIGMFGAHLLGMAILEEELNNKSASKEYLLMSAHCGIAVAENEYKRIYGSYR